MIGLIVDWERERVRSRLLILTYAGLIGRSIKFTFCNIKNCDRKAIKICSNVCNMHALSRKVQQQGSIIWIQYYSRSSTRGDVFVERGPFYFLAYNKILFSVQSWPNLVRLQLPMCTAIWSSLDCSGMLSEDQAVLSAKLL